MEIQINNFKCYPKATFTFPNSGITLLKGQSGKTATGYQYLWGEGGIGLPTHPIIDDNFRSPVDPERGRIREMILQNPSASDLILQWYRRQRYY